MSSDNKLGKLFKPSTIAVVGASKNPEKTGNIILRNIIDGGFKGDIFPINPGAEEILGLRAYSSLTDVPGDLDLVVIVVPAIAVPDVMKQAGEKKVGGAIIISGGFKEAGNEELESEVINVAKSFGIRVVGPNCQGITYTSSNLCAFWPLIKKKGEMAIISQSGTVAAALGEWAEKDGIGVSSCVSLGNKADVSEIDLVEFFSNDPGTSVISIYVEGTSNGRRFMQVCKEAAQKKPIVVFRPGRSNKGRIAAESHTKSIAGSFEIFKAACSQVGVCLASTIEDLYDFSKAMMFMNKPRSLRGKRDPFKVVVLTSSGGSGIVAVDCAEDLDIDTPVLNDETLSRLKKTLPPHCIIKNPLDLTGDTPAERYETAALEIVASSDLDAFLFVFGDPIPRSGEVVGRLRSSIGRSNKIIEIVACNIGGGQVGQEELLKIHQQRVAVFPTPERAMRALGVIAGKI